MSNNHVLLALPAHLTSMYGALARDHAIEPSVDARFVAAYLMRRGIGVELLDANLLGVDAQAAAGMVSDANPRLVVINVEGYNPSSSTPLMPAARSFTQAIRDVRPDIPMLIMGNHPASLADRTLREEPVDFVCDGEGPVTIHQLFLALQAGGGAENFAKVPSLWYRDGVHVAHATPAPLIVMNDEPSRIAWELMDPRQYRCHNWHGFYAPYDQLAPYGSFETSRGCPHKCPFCNIQSRFRTGESVRPVQTDANSYRLLAPELFVEEVAYVFERYGLSRLFVKLKDEMFFQQKRHVRRIMELLAARFPGMLNIWLYGRIDSCDPAVLDLMAAAGVKFISFGVEAGNAEVRANNDKDFTIEATLRVFEQVRAAGIYPLANFIFGLPGDTMASMEETYRLALALNPVFANMYFAQALPGSQDYRDAKAAGHLLPDDMSGVGWAGFGQYGYLARPSAFRTDLTQVEIARFRDEKQVEYHTRPEFLDMLRRDPNFGSVAVSNIESWMEDVRSIQRQIFGQ